VIDRGGFGQSQRMAQRQNLTAMPILIRSVRAAIALAMLRGADSSERCGRGSGARPATSYQPQRSAASTLERLLKGLLGSAGKGRKLVEHAEFHGAVSFTFS
jgi:hypothetical protein